jgi:hypothetical protein
MPPPFYEFTFRRTDQQAVGEGGELVQKYVDAATGSVLWLDPEDTRGEIDVSFPMDYGPALPGYDTAEEESHGRPQGTTPDHPPEGGTPPGS